MLFVCLFVFILLLFFVVVCVSYVCYQPIICIVYLAEPFFQDGIVTQAADSVAEEHGVPYFATAGNLARQSWEGAFLDSQTRDINNCRLHDFDGNGTTWQTIKLNRPFSSRSPSPSPTVVARIVFQWDDAFYSVSGPPGALTDMDIFVFDSNGKPFAGDVSINTGGDAVSVVIIRQDNNNTNNGDDDEQDAAIMTIRIAISHCSGPPPGLLKWILFGSTVSVEFDTQSPTSFAQSNGRNTAGVGATFFQLTPAFGITPPKLQGYSGAGGIPILFDTAGQRLSQPEIRLQPRFTAVDGCITTFYGSYTSFQPNGLGYYFFGTLGEKFNRKCPPMRC